MKAGGAKGGSRKSFPEGKQTRHGRPKRMGPETKGIRYQSATFPTVQGMMHYVNEQTLMMEHRRQARKTATGVDGVDKMAYDENAEENILELVSKMKKLQYRPQAVRRAYIPKGNGNAEAAWRSVLCTICG